MAQPPTVLTWREPEWLAWRPLSPLVATTGLWFIGRVWHFHFSWPVWVTVASSAWAFALVAHASAEAAGQGSRSRLFVGAALVVFSLLLGLARLPQGLVASAVPIGGLAVFQALMSLGDKRPWARRLAVTAAALAAMSVLASGVGGWPSGLRSVITVLILVVFWLAWRTAARVAIPEAPLVLARGLLFSAGVLLPVAWWMMSEMERMENWVFAALAVIAAAVRSEWRKPGLSRANLTAYMAGSIVICAVSAVAGAATPGGPARTMFLGVGVTAFLLSLGLALGLRRAIPPLLQRLVPDLAWAGFAIGLWPSALPAY